MTHRHDPYPEDWHTRNQALIAALTPDNETDEGTQHPWDWTAQELRGIPAIGRGVSGAITGTDPEDIIDQLDKRRSA